jgi:signal transduction histidine kinase/tetratricopeptide (TPR) repeat protein
VEAVHDARPSKGTTRGSLFARRYLLEHLLRQGRGITTWRALDLITDTSVILKCAALDDLAPGAELLLRHDADALTGLDHPNVAPLLDVGVEEGGAFLVAPLVPGETLRERLRRGPLSLAETLTVARGLASALDAVFSRGVLHRDLKPGNVIVDSGPLSSVTLVDFGFSRSDHPVTSLRDVPLGTARYASPEHAGLVDREVDERSDLYSLGVVLFEAVAGRPPYEGRTVGTVLRQHLSDPVPSLRTLGFAVPRALDEAIQRLLAKDPGDRYRTAGALLHDLDAIAGELAAGVTEPAVVVGTRDRRCCTLAEPSFVGRTVELATVERVLGATSAGAPAVVVVEAESGGGKTRLLDEFAKRAAERGAWVLRGGGVDQTAQLPFQALHGVTEGLAAALEGNPWAHSLADALGHHRAAACSALPRLAGVLGGVGAEGPGPEAFGETRTIDALATLLDALGTRDGQGPAVVILDDCQWADGLTARLLQHWRTHRRTGSSVMVVVAYRSEEVPAGHPLRDVAADEHFRLPPLGADEIRLLVESMAGEVDAGAVEVVNALAEGSPFMASAILHGLVESGALQCRHPGWEVDDEALEAAQSSRRAGAFLARRLDLLPPDTLTFLEAAAVLGREFELEAAADLVGHRATEAVRACGEARKRHLVWSRRREARATFVHDKVREALLDRLEPATRRELHRRAAERLAALRADRPFELAYHYDAAGEPARALPFALDAASRARAAHALDAALQQYEIAARGAEHADVATRLVVALGTGDVMMLAGRYTEARQEFEAAGDLAPDIETRLEVEWRLAELAFKHGDLDASAAACGRGLALLGKRVPRTAFGFVLGVMRETGVQVLHSLLPRLFVARRPLDRAAEDLAAARFYSRLAHVHWFTRGPVPTFWAHIREMNLAERYPASRELAQAYSEHAPLMSIVQWVTRGRRYVDRSLAIRRDLGDVWGQGNSLNFKGILLYSAGRFEEAVDECRAAIHLLERTGDRWELNIARVHLALSLYRMGRLGEAVELARAIHRDGLDIGDVQASGLAVEIWSKASCGRVPASAVAVEMARDIRDVQVRAEVAQGEAVRLIREGEADAAVDLLRAIDREVRAATVVNEYVAPRHAWLATALRVRAEGLPPYSPRRRAAVREARKAARRARRITRVYRNSRPHALRESALAAALAGRGRRARRWFDRSAACARRQGATHELAATLVAWGEVGRELGWEEASDAHLEGTARRVELEAKIGPALGVDAPVEGVSLSLLDRFDSLLDEGRRIAAGLSRDAVFAAVHHAVVTLLRPQDCTVLDVGPGTDPPVLPGGAHDATVSDSLVAAALRERRPIRLSEVRDPGDDDADSGVRSAICAPIFVRGVPAACFYAAHFGLTDLFGEDDVRVAEYVAAIAGAALENAQGFAEVEALQRSLEHRVADRTSQLTTMLAELERVNEELRVADRMKNEFVSMVSHELRTPLTPIVGLSSTLLQRWEGMEPAVRDECLASIHRQGIRLARLVDDLLEMSRIESGRVETHPRVVDVHDVLDSLGHADTDGLGDVEVRCPEGLQALADPDRLHQVLLNYLDNARKYGRPPVVIEAVANGAWVDLVVSDIGAGVPESFVGELFEKFTRAHGSSGAAGTGLGLSIVRGLARAQGGDAWYEPNEPSGSRFGVRVPRAVVPSRVGAR